MGVSIVIVVILWFLAIGFTGSLVRRVEQTEKDIVSLKKELDRQNKLRAVGK